MLDGIFNFCVLMKWFCTEALQQSAKLTGQKLQCVCVQFYLHTLCCVFIFFPTQSEVK